MVGRRCFLPFFKSKCKAEVTAEGIQKSFEELVMGKYIDKVAKLDLVTPTVEPEKAK